ncbi:MAG: hypothetical protein AB7O38_13255, partial [Pirellulaceae bacterium]
LFRSVVHGVIWSTVLLQMVAIGGETSTDQVYFDTAPAVACRAVPDGSFESANPGERLWEARIRVSALVSDPGAADLVELSYVLRTLSSDVAVHDYQPKTVLGSTYAGPIAHEEKSESSRSLGLSIAGVQNCLVKASGSGDLSSKSGTTRRYELVAPHDAVIASGTLYREHAVYFKCRPAPQATLEGAREFSVVLRAPRAWRAEGLLVQCQALGRRATMWPGRDELVTVGSARFLVGLYAGGDEPAKVAAEELAQQDALLRRAVAAHRRAHADRSELKFWPLPPWADSPSKTATLDLDALLFRSPRMASSALREAPPELVSPARAWLAARDQLTALRQTQK